MELKTHHAALALVTCALLCHVEAKDPIRELFSAFNKQYSKINAQKSVISDLSRQIMMQNFFMEERIRTDGSSGIKVARGGPKNLHNYNSNTHNTNRAFMAIHDHSNYDRTVGMGEVSVVMNGVDFRTRHNDYKMVMPSRTSREYDAVEDVPFPAVPQAVLDKPTVEEQILEMREWFKAYWWQNTTHRPWREHFTPVMVYIEAGWTLDKELVEGFQSDRHHYDAKSWQELQDKSRYTALSGSKDPAENLATLPSTIIEVNETTGEPIYAQWNYRIMCRPMRRSFGFEYLRQAEDLSFRVSQNISFPFVNKNRASRYSIYKEGDGDWFSYLDDLMYSIPGKNNRYDRLSEPLFNKGNVLDLRYPDEDRTLDTSRYHRWYKNPELDAMGVSSAARGFNDDNLFVAQTTQPRVASLPIEVCTKDSSGRRRCKEVRSRWTYALPLEVIWLTPLSSWNPFNLEIKKGLNLVEVDGRDGQTKETAYKGVDQNHYYITPAAFYSGEEIVGSPADTVRNSVFVEDPAGNPHATASSGVQIQLRPIPGVGRIRTRFPVAPIHGEGSSVWKELNALRDTLTGAVHGQPKYVNFTLPTNGEHSHHVLVPYKDYIHMVIDKGEITVTTGRTGHRHKLTMKYHKNHDKYEYTSCDDEEYCTHGHPKKLVLETKSVYTESVAIHTGGLFDN